MIARARAHLRAVRALVAEVVDVAREQHATRAGHAEVRTESNSSLPAGTSAWMVIVWPSTSPVVGVTVTLPGPAFPVEGAVGPATNAATAGGHAERDPREDGDAHEAGAELAAV